MFNIRFYFFLVVFSQYVSSDSNFYYRNQEKIELVPYNAIVKNKDTINYYQNKQGFVVGVSDKIIVKLKDDKYLKNILKEFNLFFVKELSRNLYLLKVEDTNRTISISNSLNKKKEYIKYAHPDFIKKQIHR